MKEAQPSQLRFITLAAVCLACMTDEAASFHVTRRSRFLSLPTKILAASPRDANDSPIAPVSLGTAHPNKECQELQARILHLIQGGGQDQDIVPFAEVVAVIDKHYQSRPIIFRNGDVLNEAGQNMGSAKVLSYASLHQMDKEMTLWLWGEHYRSVLQEPDGDSHANIRNFLRYGWSGVSFPDGLALSPKDP